MVKENMKNDGSQLYATGKQVYNKTLIFFLCRISPSIFLKDIYFYALFVIYILN